MRVLQTEWIIKVIWSSNSTLTYLIHVVFGFISCIRVHKAKYSLNVQYPVLGIVEIVWAPYHIFRQFKGYYIPLPKPRRNVIPSLGYTTIPSLGHEKIPFSRYPKNTLGSITYLLTCEGVMHSPTKT
jgi:hypothetical protein